MIGLVEEARAHGIDVRVVPDLYDGLAWNASVEYIGQFPTIPLHRRDFPIGSFMAKRALDLGLSSLALLALSPLLLVIGVAVKLDSRGAVFYQAQRIGRKGRTFKCFKFRTMVQDADEQKAHMGHLNERDGILFKVANDPRITGVGKLLRKYSLDELPQFWNVLRGDMSLVGPRPPIASEVQQYDLSTCAGSTFCPASPACGRWKRVRTHRSTATFHWTPPTSKTGRLWLDLKILVRTVSVVLGGTGT